jgi:hypothetical protein
MTMKDEIEAFRQIPEISKWIKAADLKPRTKEEYLLRLMHLFEKMQISPTQFLQECNSNRKQLLGRIKVTLGEVLVICLFSVNSKFNLLPFEDSILRSRRAPIPGIYLEKSFGFTVRVPTSCVSNSNNSCGACAGFSVQ